MGGLGLPLWYRPCYHLPAVQTPEGINVSTGGQSQRRIAAQPAGWVWYGWGVAAALILFSYAATAATITLKVKAYNKSQTEKRTTLVRTALPPFAGPSTIISLGELELSYDVATKTYYVHKQIELEPGQARTFEVVLNDIWSIPEKSLTEYEDHAKALADATKDTPGVDTSRKMAGVVEESLKAIAARQRAYAVGVAPAADHIRAYESNLKAIEQVRKDVGVLENLAIAAGKDPGAILGSPLVPPPADLGAGGRTDQVVVLRIKVTNPSLTEKRTPPVRQDLPVEVGPTDILDAGGLQVGFDSAQGLTYVYTEAVELPAQQSREFEVRIRNPWGGAEEHLARLKKRIADLIEIGRKTQAYGSVTNGMAGIAIDLESLATNKPPATLNEEYVAFARQRADRLRQIEGRIMRIEELFQANQKPADLFVAPMLNVKPPNPQTTWRIIWIIIIFLGVFSVFFFFRWYGRSKSETMDRRGAGPAGPTVPPPDSGSPGQGPAAP